MLIYLTDDDTGDRLLFREAMRLVSPNASIEEFEDAEDLLRGLANKKNVPDLIFLDLNMPLRTGHECMIDLRERGFLAKIPVIILSTSDNPKDLDQAYFNGASLYLVKPNSFTDLEKIVGGVMAIDWSRFVRPSREEFLFKPSVQQS